MRLSSLFTQGSQLHTENGGKELPAALERNLNNGLREIAGKTQGQSVTGEVIEKNGSDILLAIGKDQLLRARLDGNISIEPGQLMTFAILKNAGGSKVLLSPLFANTANDPNISRALQMAGLPETAATVKMVQIMMQEGMSIDKNSLAQMMRLMGQNPQAGLETLVQLNRLGLPVTENNIFQMEAYKSLEHQMTEGLRDIADALGETFTQMVSSGNAEEGVALYREIFTFLAGEADMESAPGGTGGAQGVPAQEGTALKPDISELFSEILSEGKETAFGKELLESLGLSGKEFSSLADQMLKAGVPKELVRQLASGELPVKELLGRLGSLIRDSELAGESRDFAPLLGGKEFHALLKNEMSKQWMLTPEEVAGEKKVEELYQRLNSQLSRLSRALEQNSASDTPAAKAVSNMSGSIDFMNQLNQMFTYVQLPLKMQGKDANGELYVYTNKKNLAKKDGEVSALLHLDMESLGSVDVHVALRDSKVSTKFYLRDDSALDLIASHIDLLNERLNKRGYSMSASFVKKGEEGPETVMEEILKQVKNISVLSGNSFDARA